MQKVNGYAFMMLTLLFISSLMAASASGYVGVKASDASPIHNINTGLNYMSIQAAIDDPQTVNGNTILVDAGTYNTTFEVDKSLAIIGSGRDTTVVDGGGSNSVVYVEADNVLIEGFTVKGGLVGIYVVHSRNSVLQENSFRDMASSSYAIYFAIWAVYADNLRIDQNIVGPNPCSGILVSNSLGFQAMDNDVHNNGGYGINANASLNGAIIGNNASQNAYDGIGLLRGCRNVTITENNIRDNMFGVDIIDPDCVDNLIYLNNIINNTKQASAVSPNRWDNGFEGNYWSDYAGVDQDQDGIGDTPYLVSNSNTDNYPLMNPWSLPDIAVTDLTSAKTVIGLSYDFNVTVGVAKFGDFQETFNLTLYATIFIVQQNVTLQIASQNVTLESSNYANIIFVVNTTGYPYGNYTISAYAWPVPNETFTADNKLAGGTVELSVPGDINGDGTVNILDAITLANAFGATPSSSNWNPNADVNGDGVVNILDAIILANHFLQHYP